MKTSMLVALLLLIPAACMPGAQPAEQPSPEVLPPEPAEDGSIPWAPGEGPGPARDVGEQPPSQDELASAMPESQTTDDGIVSAGANPGCTGRAPAALRAEVQARTSALKVCNERAPAEFRGSGTLKYTLRVEADGGVLTIYQLENKLQLNDVIACVEAKLKEKFEERPISGCAQFVVPYELVVEEGQEIVPEQK